MKRKRNPVQITLIIVYIITQLILFFNVTYNNVDDFIIGQSSLQFLLFVIISFLPVIFAHTFIFSDKRFNILFDVIAIGIQYILILLLFAKMGNDYWTFVNVSSWSGSFVQRIAKLDNCFFYIISTELLVSFIIIIKCLGIIPCRKKFFKTALMIVPVITSIIILVYLLNNRPVFKG